MSSLPWKESIRASRHGGYEWNPNKDDSADVGLVNLGVAEDFLDRLKGPVEEVPQNGPGQGSVGVDTLVASI